MQNKKIELDYLKKADWVEINRQSEWEDNFKIYQIAAFLDCAPENLQETSKVYYGYLYRNSIAVCFDDFLKKYNYTKVKEINLESNGFYPVKKEDIELSPKVHKRCIVDGVFFLVKEDFKVVVEFMEGYSSEKTWYVELTYRKEDESKALKFLIDLNGYAMDHCYLKKAKIDPALSHVEIGSNYTWDDIILPELTKQEIHANVDNLINSIEIYKENKINFKRGLILKGIPGTGKSLLGKIICQNVDCTFIWVTPKYLTNSLNVSLICDLARELSPSVLFLEDIDLYGENRSLNSNNSLLGELMNRLDGLVENHYVIVIATTNQPDVLEEALRNRPGRFDRLLDIPLPDLDGRLKMLQLYTQNVKLEEMDLMEIASKTDKFTGAHIKELVNTATMLAIDQKSWDDKGKVVLKAKYFYDNIQKVKNKKIEAIVGFKSSKEELDDDDLPPFPGIPVKGGF
jgi:SpoVK/Ycf46/Vps4 family AAA+-type ATPase